MGEEVITIYRRRVLEYEVYEMNYLEEHDHGCSLAMEMLGVFLIIAVVCALSLQMFQHTASLGHRGHATVRKARKVVSTLSTTDLTGHRTAVRRL